MPASNEHVTQVALKMAIDNHSTIIELIKQLKELGIDIDVDAVKKQADERAASLRKEIQDVLNK